MGVSGSAKDVRCSQEEGPLRLDAEVGRVIPLLRGKPLKRFAIVVTATLAALMLTATAALAASPHVVGNPTATVSGNSLIVSASVAGLGSVPSVELGLEGTVSVDSRCYTRSGNKPQAANKQESIAVDQTGTFPVRNGRTNATFTVTPLSTLTCPGGQHVVIESVSFTDLRLTYMGSTLYTFSS
jgi:hypothetical protein